MKYIVGIDEVGRGPVAGPVAVGAFVFLDQNISNDFKEARDSKQLSEKRREEWFEKIKKAKEESLIDFHVAFRSEKMIDEKGISFAIKESINEVLERLNLASNLIEVLLDGGLKAPSIYLQRTIIRGDESEQAIALASICAKVSRDREMKKIALEYPEYGFEKHKGYGTKEHYEAIQKHGICPLHRKSFLSKTLAKKS